MVSHRHRPCQKHVLVGGDLNAVPVWGCVKAEKQQCDEVLTIADYGTAILVIVEQIKCFVSAMLA